MKTYKDIRFPLIAGLILSITGCSALQGPQRVTAENLMGKDINQAFAQLGKPVSIEPSETSRWLPRKADHTVYEFAQENGLNYHDRVVGNYMDYSSGPTNVTVHDAGYTTNYCRTMLFVDNHTKIIDYYVIDGCGLGNDTGGFHQFGLN